MDIKTFKVERWMNEYEDDCTYNLAETCIDSLTVRELTEMAGLDTAEFMNELADTRLTYGHIFGSPELLEGIAGLYGELIRPEHVVPMHGAIGANNHVIMALIDPSDNMVSVMPTYQQHYSIPESIGAEVRILNLNLENHFLPDIDKLKELVDENTKMITMNSPNNPSGSLIPKDVMEQVIEVARSVGAYVLCDEVYRGISEDGSYMYSVVDLYEKGISVGSMSKSWSMAGVRLGWIVTRDMDLIHRFHERRDYDTISCAVIDDKLAALALANKDKIIERNRAILLKNRQILDDWVNATPEVYYQRPVAGTTALVYYKKDMPSRELCDKLMKSKGVLFTPGECFEMEGAVRIGYAFDPEVLQKGLDLFTEFLHEY
ncbi:MAG: aminotransferase [Clostridiales bacterium]|nr:aminotransferase [Clostridiales bacterium]